tara:strand:- start:360 stop:479 length:120 start_codon:yes stop_codon:yes gene_type:complete
MKSAAAEEKKKLGDSIFCKKVLREQSVLMAVFAVIREGR